jgi:glycerate-2-kinase
MLSGHALVRDLFDAALAAVNPEAAVTRALATVETGDAAPHVIAIGKAAVPMANAALATLRARGVVPPGGVVVSPGGAGALAGSLVHLAGDHPIPGGQSLAAADAVGRAVGAIGAKDDCWVLLSGGASSLAAAPVPGVEPDALAELFRVLLGSGLPIADVNAVRRRVLRWGAGRLAAAIPARHIRVLAISDVPGDEPGDIGSGPCSPDPTSDTDLVERLAAAGVGASIPAPVRHRLARERRRVSDHPDATSRRISFEIVGRNADAIDGAVRRAGELEIVAVRGATLSGEASAAGEESARALLALRDGVPSEGRHRHACLVRGGETVVTLGPAAGRGGRSQELALAGARLLAGHAGVTLLAAGTDGRDGPTDAAGAIVDGATWRRIEAADVDPDAALAAHHAYRALDRGGALLRTGPTGTNVMDLVIGVCETA